MEIEKLEDIVIQAFREYPETISSNAVLWARISRALATQQQIVSVDSFIDAVVKGKIPSSHSIAAAASNVRKSNPEYEPTEEQRAKKHEVQQQYINRYNQI